MAVRLHIEKDLREQKQSILHLMPCKIHGDEVANVSSYFEPYIRKTNDGCYTSSFRGYPLQGKKIQIPNGYKGITFFEHKKPDTEHKKPDTEHMQRNLYSTGVFSEFTYWNYDKIPSKNDTLIAALDWIDIAEALHSTDT